LPSNSPHVHMILRVDLVGSHGRWKRPCLVSTAALRNLVKVRLTTCGFLSRQLLIGKGDVKSRASLLQTAASILQESFEPICDLSTGEDLVPQMVHSEGVKDHDFQGMHTVMLFFKGKPVSVATLRVFGPFLAEMPLVATRECARRQGHCRALLAAVETCLQELQVRHLIKRELQIQGCWDAFFVVPAGALRLPVGQAIKA
jgi:hypothetical protein